VPPTWSAVEMLSSRVHWLLAVGDDGSHEQWKQHVDLQGNN
jgi:hypothetical protein